MKESGMNLRSEVEADVRLILDVFSGTDGGVGFVKFRVLIEALDKQASEGDGNAELVLDAVRRFARLVRIANGPLPVYVQP